MCCHLRSVAKMLMVPVQRRDVVGPRRGATQNDAAHRIRCAQLWLVLLPQQHPPHRPASNSTSQPTGTEQYHPFLLLSIFFIFTIKSTRAITHFQKNINYEIYSEKNWLWAICFVYCPVVSFLQIIPCLQPSHRIYNLWPKLILPLWGSNKRRSRVELAVGIGHECFSDGRLNTA